MSLLHQSRHPCVHCQGNAFRAEFEEVDGLGPVRYLRCLNCDAAYPEYSERQREILESWEAEEDAVRTQAQAEIAREILEEKHPEISRPFAVRVNGGRIGMFASQAEASTAMRQYAEQWAKPGSKLELWHEPYYGARKCLEEVSA